MAYQGDGSDHELTTEDLLSAILLELKRLNTYYQEGFGNRINDEDIES